MSNQTNIVSIDSQPIMTAAEAHREALRAWRDGQHQERIVDFAQRLDDNLVKAIERRAMDIVAAI
jgi:hypothetical protein